MSKVARTRSSGMPWLQGTQSLHIETGDQFGDRITHPVACSPGCLGVALTCPGYFAYPFAKERG